MGSTRSASSSPSYTSTSVEKPEASYGSLGRYSPTESDAAKSRLGMPAAPETKQEQPSYLGQAQQSTAPTTRPKSMVGEVRKAGSQMFSEALGVNNDAQQDEGLKVPGVSTSRMAGEILQGFSDSLSEKLDPTKGAEEEVDPSRYGIGAPNKPSGAQYTAAAAAPFG